jgi:hypothetical protein
MNKRIQNNLQVQKVKLTVNFPEVALDAIRPIVLLVSLQESIGLSMKLNLALFATDLNECSIIINYKHLSASVFFLKVQLFIP